jgi:hypothetical protein
MEGMQMAATDDAQAMLEAGAPPHNLNAWHAIDWQRVGEEVKRLQVRIVKATQTNRQCKRKSLQWLRAILANSLVQRKS